MYLRPVGHVRSQVSEYQHDVWRHNYKCMCTCTCVFDDIVESRIPYTRGFIGESNYFGEFVCKKQLADFILAI